MAKNLIPLVFCAAFWAAACFVCLFRKDRSLQGADRIIVPCGRAVRRIPDRLRPKPSSPGRRDKTLANLTELKGRKEGKEAYALYQARKAGWMALSFLMCLTLYSVSQVLHPDSKGSRVWLLERPAAGEGNEKKSLWMEVAYAGKTLEKTVTVTVPQQEETEEETQQNLEEVMEGLKNRFDGKIVFSDVDLPRKLSGVSLSYTSLTPDLVDGDGRVKARVGTTRQSLALSATGRANGQKKTVKLLFYLGAFADLSENQRLALEEKQLTADLKEGSYANASEVDLPSSTQEGARVTFYEKTEDNRFLWMILFLLFPMAALIRQDVKLKNQVKIRRQKIEASYPSFIGELVILIGSGMSLSSAWQKIGSDYGKMIMETGVSNEAEDPLLEEVERTSRQLQEGTPMKEVLSDFASRMRSRQVRRLTSLLQQNLKRGDEFLLVRLRELSDEEWENRKRQVKEKSEQADTKLLIPLGMMLVVVLILVTAPALMSMQL